MPNAQAPTPRTLTFPRKARLSLAKQYAAVYEAKVKKTRGPLTVFAMPNALPHCRLGLSVGRRVGGAVVRSRVKRLIREAFRHEQHDLPRGESGGYDLVVNARAHEAATLADYRAWLRGAAEAAHREWQKKGRDA